LTWSKPRKPTTQAGKIHPSPYHMMIFLIPVMWIRRWDKYQIKPSNQ